MSLNSGPFWQKAENGQLRKKQLPQGLLYEIPLPLYIMHWGV
jgi:hypothetical protein